MAASSSSRENRKPGSSGILAAPPLTLSRGVASISGFLVEKPVRVFLENGGQQFQQIGRRNPLSGLDHAQVGNRRRQLRVKLYAAGGQVLQRQPVPLAERAELGAEEVTFSEQSGHKSVVKFTR
jgi:hypothetical protein